MSETRELVGPSDHKVFLTNSRDTYLLTLPESLGKIWKVSYCSSFLYGIFCRVRYLVFSPVMALRGVNINVPPAWFCF